MSLNELHRHLYLLFSRVASELNEKTSKVQKAKLDAMMERTHTNYELGKIRQDMWRGGKRKEEKRGEEKEVLNASNSALTLNTIINKGP